MARASAYDFSVQPTSTPSTGRGGYTSRNPPNVFAPPDVLTPENLPTQYGRTSGVPGTATRAADTGVVARTTGATPQTPVNQETGLPEYASLPGANQPPPPYTLPTATAGSGSAGGISIPGLGTIGGGGSAAVDWAYQDLDNPDMDWLRQYIQSGAQPVDQLPAWQAMVKAQQENIERNAADISEYFNVAGGRFSSGFGTAMGDFYEQTSLDQNAQLLAAVAAAQENAQGRVAEGANTLAGFDFQSEIARNQFALEKAMSEASNRTSLGVAGIGANAQVQSAGIGANAQVQSATISAQTQASIANAQISAELQRQRVQNTWQQEQNSLDRALDASSQLSRQDHEFTQFMIQQSNYMDIASMENATQVLQNYLDYDIASINANNATAANLFNQWYQTMALGQSLGGDEWEATANQQLLEYLEYIRTQVELNPLNPAAQGAAGEGVVTTPPQYPGSAGGNSFSRYA